MFIGSKMNIKFTKMHALGNDFMVLDGISQSIRLNRERIVALSDRHCGVGFDQLLIVEPSNSAKADFFYSIFNADGTEVAQCGNGARALAKFIHDQKLTSKNLLKLQTHQMIIDVLFENEKTITVNLGIPEFLAKEIPTTFEKTGSLYSLQNESKNYSFEALNIGNPHAILWVDDLAKTQVEKIGKIFSTHPQFPQGANVEFVQILDANCISVRVYERGVAETFSCGSGACAAVIASKLHKNISDTVMVQFPKGALKVKWEGWGQPAYLTGEATTVFEGTLNLET